MKIFRTYISYIAALLSTATAVLSCSTGDFVPILDNEPAYHNRSILITGIVSDTYGQPLEDITINFKAYPHDQADASPISSETVYTNSKGTYSIHSDGADLQLLCTITAEDESGTYGIQTQQVIITWKGSSYDTETKIFIVNDCNFLLDRK